ncbi:MAG: hypothetical protein WKF93_04470 [Acidimicrobiales bacterium]
MTKGTRWNAAIGVLVAAALLALVLGSEAFVDRAFGAGSGNSRTFKAVLARPNWTDSQLVGFRLVRSMDSWRFLFLVLWPLVTAGLAYGLGGANRFLAGWTAAVGGGAVAGGIQFLELTRQSRNVAFAIEGAGSGATFGLFVGWLLGIVVLVLGPTRSGGSGGSGGQFTTGAEPPPWGNQAPTASGPPAGAFGPPTADGWPDPSPPMPPGPAPDIPRLPPRPNDGDPTRVAPRAP